MTGRRGSPDPGLAGSEVLWRPSPDAQARSQLGRYLDWLESRGRRFTSYSDLWHWSVTDLEGFWGSLWDYFAIEAATPYERVLSEPVMPGARWFPGATLNYAAHLMRGALRIPGVAVAARSQTRHPWDLTGAELEALVGKARAGLQRAGVKRGDRVAAYLPDVPETLVAFLATASLGAVWSSCAPEFGASAVVNRLRQIEPKVLLVVDGYRYGHTTVSRRDEAAAIRGALPSVEVSVTLPYLDPHGPIPEGTISWEELLHDDGPADFDPVPFEDPLWVLYSSGTTGAPKPIVHSHGGALLEHLKNHVFHQDLGPGDRAFFFSTTGWMVWNWRNAALAAESSVVLYDGSPLSPDLSCLWRLAEETGVTFFGGSAPFYMNCSRNGLVPREIADLSKLRSVCSSGAPLPAEGFRWIYSAVGDDLYFQSASGGTDVVSAFVGGNPLLPVVAGEIAGPCLGCRVESYDEAGRPVIGEEGELVITAPMPSMPIGFWGDDDGARLRAAYFDHYPGIWRHGDWATITKEGTFIISGRSDATLNRGGVRLGTSEFYTIVESHPHVADSLVVHLDDPDAGPGELLLFVVLKDGDLNDDLVSDIAGRLRHSLSPRHVPDRVFSVPAIPRTLSGKRLEVPVKRILTGARATDVANPESLAEPGALQSFERLAFEQSTVERGARWRNGP